MHNNWPHTQHYVIAFVWLSFLIFLTAYCIYIITLVILFLSFNSRFPNENRPPIIQYYRCECEEYIKIIKLGC